jgi:phosphohistidine phosphatase
LAIDHEGERKMELVLWRHADAEMGVHDLKRELTDKGRKQAAKVARWLRPRLDAHWEVLVSPAARAKQTADALDLKYDVRLTLGPAETENALLREVDWPGNERNVVVVGHQPTLGRVAAKLLTGHFGDTTIKKGAIWWFSSRIDEDFSSGQTVLRAVIAPDFAD